MSNWPENYEIPKPPFPPAPEVPVAEPVAEPKPEKPEDPAKVSRRAYKNAMRLMFTVRNKTVKECGHKYDDMRPPRNNCHFCWFAYFNHHGELVIELDKALKEVGGEMIIAVNGKKFYTMYMRFMSTIAQWKAEADALKGTDGEGQGNEGSNEGTSADNQGEQVQSTPGIGSDPQRGTEDNQ